MEGTLRAIRSTHRGAAACVLALIGPWAIPAPAGAATLEYDEAVHHEVPWYGEAIDCDIKAINGIDRGQGCYQTYGDVFHVWDTNKDGQSTGVHWKLSDGSRFGICRNKLGASGEPGDCDKNFPETGVILYMRFGHCDADADTTCHKVADYDWGSWVHGET